MNEESQAVIDKHMKRLGLKTDSEKRADQYQREKEYTIHSDRIVMVIALVGLLIWWLSS